VLEILVTNLPQGFGLQLRAGLSAFKVSGTVSDFLAEQRILSKLRGYSHHSTTHYQAVFTDVSAVKASYVSLGINT
jgi:hypothetical protein